MPYSYMEISSISPQRRWNTTRYHRHSIEKRIPISRSENHSIKLSHLIAHGHIKSVLVTVRMKNKRASMKNPSALCERNLSKYLVTLQP